MRMNAWFPMLMALALSAQGLPGNVSADSEWRLRKDHKVMDAVLNLNEQAKKEEMITIKNYFLDLKKTVKPLPINPALGAEVKPDSIDPQ